MAWWNRDRHLDAGWTSKISEVPLPEIIEAKPGQVIPCDNPKDVVTLPKDPGPDFATKPDDKIGYCFGYVCPKKHVNQTFENITVDGYRERRVCQKCGAVSKPATIKCTAEPQWGDCSYPYIGSPLPEPMWAWYNSWQSNWGRGLNIGETLWTKHEFVHYLESPKRRKK